MTKTVALTIQKWGNSLAVRIPATLARSAHVHLGSPVEMAINEGDIVIKSMGKLTLDDRLKMFDPEKHGGEIMQSGREGLEKF